MEKTREYVGDDKFPYHYKYEHMAVTTDCVIFSFDGKDLLVLLVKRGVDPFKGDWAFPGGFLLMNETAKEGALRELQSETGFVPSYLDELGTFSTVDRDPRERTVTIAFVALVKPGAVQGMDDAAEARWFPVSGMPSLAFDHKDIFISALEYLRKAVCFEPICFEMMDEEFTLPSLQRLYEAILGRKFDRANFQKKILSYGLVESVSPKSYYREHEKKEPVKGGLVMKPVSELFGKDTESRSFEDTSAPSWSRKVITYIFNRKAYEKFKEKGNRLEF